MALPARPLALAFLIGLTCSAPVRALTFATPTSLAEPTCLDEEDEKSDDGAASDDDTSWRDDLTRSRHTLSLDGGALSYNATAGTMTLEEEDGTDKADIFFVAYTLDGVENTAQRPITFCFNGGPGSSSVWLHMGAFGPRKVLMTNDPGTSAPPYPLVDNKDCLLDITDLVFIDPVSTGYSRASEGQDDSDFHGVDQDIRAVADFIRLYTTRFKRWNSPKFLAGESYGTTRAAGLAGYLQGNLGMYLNGLVLVSSILDFGTARFDAGNDLPYPLFLPTYAACAWYHGALEPELQADLSATLAEVEAFALGDYMLALAQGASLPDSERDAIAARLARYTGLSVDYVLRSNLRPVIHEFVKELRRDERLTIGRLDARYVGRDSDSIGSRSEYDPSYAAIQGPYTSALNHYLRTELKYENDLPYEILTGRVQPWNYGRGNRYVNTADTLRSAMSKNTHLKVFVANGYFDLATPYFATRYTFDHLGLQPALQDNISMSYYEAGHMMYIHEASSAQLRKDIGQFISNTLQN